MASMAPAAGDSLQASGGRLKDWIHEKPWHFWVTVAIGLVALYLAFKGYQSYMANGAAPGTVSGMGPSASPSVASGDTTASTGASSPGVTRNTGSNWYDQFLYTNPNTGAMDAGNAGWFSVGGPGEPASLNTLAGLAAFFHLRGGAKDLSLNPHNAGLRTTDPNAPLPSGTEVWITQSTIQTQ